MANALASPAVCSTCGELLGAAGFCLACLIRIGLGDEESSDAATRFGDFEIERRDDGSLDELGRGAMGVTYRAIDRVLNRTVALKVIEAPAPNAPAVHERFLREARAAAGLRHPNIATVFQFGASPEGERCYCAMELVEGETLEARVRREGALNPKLALAIAIQVTRALIAAAERGLVHRDLKPANIMLTRGEDGAELAVKVIDFGLAKAANAAADMELTHGGFVGTPAFASPEQFARGTIDARTDIYALGVTIWFALTAGLPFAGTTLEEIRDRQGQHALPFEELRSRTVPPALIDLLRSCLALDPAKRPASPRELLAALESCRAQVATKRRQRIAVAALAGAILVVGLFLFFVARSQPNATGPAAAAFPELEKGVAVLPFENLSAQTEDAFLAGAIQDDVLTSVGKIKDLKVIARGSVAQYRGRTAGSKVGEIGRALGVSHVLEGSVRRIGEGVVLNVALIDARDERQVWSERYERTLADSSSLQGELALEIARALQARLTPLENSVALARPTENPDAYLLYLRARESENRGFSIPALALYREAFELDPKFALARARFALRAGFLNYQKTEPDLSAKAKAEAEEALRLQPNLGEARLALALYYRHHDGDVERALTELRRAAELLPNSAEVQLIAAFFYKQQGKFRDRLAALRRAEALDPRDTQALSYLILTFRWVRDWPEAMRALDRRAVLPSRSAYVVSTWSRACDEFRLSGNIDVLKQAVVAEEAIPSGEVPAARLDYERFEIAMFERDYASAARFLSQVPPDVFGGVEAPLFMIAGHGKPFQEALLAVASGAEPTIKGETLERAERATRASLESESGPTLAKHLAELALLHAFRGRKEEAVQAAERMIEVRSRVQGVIEKNDLSAALALVYAQTGETEKALDLIEHLLTVPAELQDGSVYNMTLTDLKWRWAWDPLREHPRFQKLLAGPEPVTVY